MAAQRSPAGPAYTERLTVPWHWWLMILAVVTAVVTPLAWNAPTPVRGLTYATWLAATAAGLWWLGRIRVAVDDGELRVDDARLPAGFVAEVVPLSPAGRQELLGPAADPLGFVVQRPWIGGAVQVVLDDPADPTPYWLVSTRHPDRLAAALAAATAATVAGAPDGGPGRPAAGDPASG